jgi:hypothetical protein
MNTLKKPTQVNKKIKASFFPIRLGGGIIFTCKLATIRAIPSDFPNGTRSLLHENNRNK